MHGSIAVVYGVVNEVNGKTYVGVTEDIDVRWKLHRNLLRRGKHHCKEMQNDWDVMGDVFHIEAIQCVYERDDKGIIERCWKGWYVMHGKAYNGETELRRSQYLSLPRSPKLAAIDSITIEQVSA